MSPYPAATNKNSRHARDVVTHAAENTSLGLQASEESTRIANGSPITPPAPCAQTTIVDASRVLNNIQQTQLVGSKRPHDENLFEMPALDASQPGRSARQKQPGGPRVATTPLDVDYASNSDAVESYQALPTSTKPINISDLNPFLLEDWVLEARVVARGDERSWSTLDRAGTLLQVHIADGNGDVAKVTLFNSAIPTFDSLLTHGACCSFSGAEIKFANKTFSCDPFDITFDNRSKITLLPPDRVPVAPLKLCTTISQVAQLPNQSHVSVLCILTKFGPEKRIATKKGKDTSKREVLVVDSSEHQIVCVLWGPHASEDLTCNLRKPVLIRHAQVVDFNGHRKLNIGAQASLLFEPAFREASDIMQWYSSLTGDATFPFVDCPSLA